MASSLEYVNYVCDQLRSFGSVRSQLMFGDYMVYLNAKPVVLICDDVAYCKQLPQLAPFLQDAPRGIPYAGAKERWILDIEDRALLEHVIPILEAGTPYPKRKKSAAKEA